jgi:DNA replication protein DnaC
MKRKVYESSSEYIEAKMKEFKLVDMRHSFRDLIEEARDCGMDHEDFLLRLIQTEDEGKHDRRRSKLTTEASFETLKQLEEIDYSFNPSIDKTKIDELAKLDFLEAGENILIIGPPGVGKSMIATGIGLKACDAGRSVLFANAKELLDRLCESVREGTLKQSLKKLNKVKLLIIDELSYTKMDKERESLFFQVIRGRYEKNSLVITTNLPVGRWDELFTDALAATAILDRLLHHCHVISISGESYRIKSKKSVLNRKETV